MKKLKCGQIICLVPHRWTHSGWAVLSGSRGPWKNVGGMLYDSPDLGTQHLGWAGALSQVPRVCPALSTWDQPLAADVYVTAY